MKVTQIYLFKTLVVALLFCTACNVSANAAIETDAQGMEKVSDASLTLLGNGIHDSKSSQSIALACAGQMVAGSAGQRACNIMRFILVDEKQDAYWLGSTFQLVAGSNSDTLKRSLKKFAREKTQAQRSRRERLNQTRRSLVQGLFLDKPGFTERDVLGAIALAAGIATMAISNAPVIGISAIGSLAVVALINSFCGMGFGFGVFDFISPVGRTAIWVAGTGVLYTAWGARDAIHGVSESNQFEQASHTLIQQDGWNWSEKPKKVSTRRFNHFKDLILENAMLNVSGITP